MRWGRQQCPHRVLLAAEIDAANGGDGQISWPPPGDQVASVVTGSRRSGSSAGPGADQASACRESPGGAVYPVAGEAGVFEAHQGCRASASSSPLVTPRRRWIAPITGLVMAGHRGDSAARGPLRPAPEVQSQNTGRMPVRDDDVDKQPSARRRPTPRKTISGRRRARCGTGCRLRVRVHPFVGVDHQQG